MSDGRKARRAAKSLQAALNGLLVPPTGYKGERKMTKQADTFRAAIKAEAPALGFEVAHCDLRRGIIHLRRGTEVLGSGAYGRFGKIEHAINDVHNIAKYGRRLDRIKGSVYFNQ